MVAVSDSDSSLLVTVAVMVPSGSVRTSAELKVAEYAPPAPAVTVLVTLALPFSIST